jgi:iron complex outermembrane receptor protein
MRAILYAATALTTFASTSAWAQTGSTAPGSQTPPPAPATPTPGAAATDNQVEQIIVTAQRRRERAQDVPIAISVFSGEQLQARGVTNALQLGQYVPNLVAQNNTGIGSANAYFLRGLGSTETIATFDPPVGTYVDDIYLSRQNANNLALFDVARVEVLRGPQGTLFGRNTTGGAINVIMRDPGKDFGGYAELGFGKYGKKLARASVDIPFSSQFAVKLTGYWQDDKGYVKNITTGQRLNDDDGWGARLGTRADLGNVRWRGSWSHIVSKGDNILNFECNPANPNDCQGRFVSTGLREGRAAPGTYAPLTITGEKANFGLGQKATSDILASNLSIDVWPDTTLAFITGYVHLRQKFAYDFFDGRSSPTIALPFPPVRGFTRGGFDILNDGTHNQFTQEIKLNGKLGGDLIDYVAGLYYINEKNKTDFADIFSLSQTSALLLADRLLHNSTKAYAGYAQADVNITQQVKLTAGIRYTDETKKIDLRDNRASCQVTPAPATCLFNANLIAPSGAVIPTKLETKIWTPRFAINYKPTSDILLFASATRGFKSGGWNARASAPSQFLPFDPEKVWSYEIGAKTEFFDHRLRANLTAFLLDVSDLQILAGLLNTTTGALTFLTRNFADYRNKGLELELNAVPVRGLNVYANVGYSHDKYIVPSGRPPVDIYGIQSVEAQQASCLAALAAGKIPGGPNIPATQPSITACAAGIVTANGTIATPVRTPDWTFATGASYDAHLGGGYTLVPSINASFHSKQEVAIANFSIYNAPVTGTNGTFPANPFGNGPFIVGAHSSAAWIFNAGMALNAPENRWQLSVNCTNCFNKSFIQTSLSNYSYLNEPMKWEVRARYNF